MNATKARLTLAVALVLPIVCSAQPLLAQECVDAATRTSSYSRTSTPSFQGSAFRSGSMSSHAKAGFAEDKQYDVFIEHTFPVQPAPDIRFRARVSVLAGGTEAWAAPGSGFAGAGVSLKLTAWRGSRSTPICTDERILDSRSTPSFHTSNSLRVDSYELSCRAEFTGSAGQIHVMVTLHTWATAGAFAGASARAGVRVSEMAIQRCCVGAMDVPDGVVPLFSWYSPSREDNFISSHPVWAGCNGSMRNPDYHFVRLEGFAFDPSGSQPPGTIPLFSWYSHERGDNHATTQHAASGEIAQGLMPNYGFNRLEGYIYDRSGTPPPGAVPLYRWYSNDRKDNWTTTQHQSEGETGSGLSPSYGPPRLEGFLPNP